VSSEANGNATGSWPFRKWLALGLFLLLLMLQYQLWWGTGGWLDLQTVEKRVATQEAVNAPLRDRNVRLAAEVTDLKQGLDAIEERARSDMGMVRADEQFFWVPGVAIEPQLIEINAGLVAPVKAASQ
jgi:cell division protein FtsB